MAMRQERRLAPGYYVVDRNEAQRREDYKITEAQLRAMLARIPSQAVAEEVERRYREALRQAQRRS